MSAYAEAVVWQPATVVFYVLFALALFLTGMQMATMACFSSPEYAHAVLSLLCPASSLLLTVSPAVRIAKICRASQPNPDDLSPTLYFFFWLQNFAGFLYGTRVHEWAIQVASGFAMTAQVVWMLVWMGLTWSRSQDRLLFLATLALLHVAVLFIFEMMPLTVHGAVYALLCLLPNLDNAYRIFKSETPVEIPVLVALLICGGLWTLLGDLIDNPAVYWPSLLAFTLNSGCVGFVWNLRKDAGDIELVNLTHPKTEEL
ncbi:MAG: uncharacterized protein KVP18_003523 [Porospora cf. gigantea A]|nr:MAG: hypothetical protein KVP18_003523 [Porospora cf. gigantea A]